MIKGGSADVAFGSNKTGYFDSNKAYKEPEMTEYIPIWCHSIVNNSVKKFEFSDKTSNGS